MAAMWQQLHGVMGLWLLLAVGLALLSGVLRSARFKGWLGERLVRRWLAQGLDPQHYHALHDLTLRLHDGSTTQIDHVVVSVHGVFVLETKHLQGWIFGAERQQEWTQTFYRHRVRFQNPLRQNWRHLKALETLLDVPLAHLHSVVVLTGTAQFKTAMPAQVVQGAAVVPYVRSFNAQLLAPEAVQRILQQLDAQRLAPTHATHRAHVAQLRQRHAPARGGVARFHSRFGDRACNGNGACGGPAATTPAGGRGGGRHPRADGAGAAPGASTHNAAGRRPLPALCGAPGGPQRVARRRGLAALLALPALSRVPPHAAAHGAGLAAGGMRALSACWI
ncbi:nuclease-related domain-containing protein [Comamonas aquatica]|uniref:nuclease-related domain-containing protein n=1 Tax=Comamonas aquatica TaxID=225991 RepID=UPI0034D6DA9D